MENVIVDTELGGYSRREIEDFSGDNRQQGWACRSAALSDANKLFLKRQLDFWVSMFTLVFVLSWFVPLVALLIKVTSKGPVFFKQKRHGINNQVFYCYKFRTMIVNSEADTRQATKDDNRVTRIGKFLRSTSLDELPQVINVLMGDMSLVGPRPHTVPMNLEFARQIPGYMSRHSIKPGITGLAQCRGYRGEINSFHELQGRYKLDMLYLKKWCLFLDLKIMVSTLLMMMRKNQKAY